MWTYDHIITQDLPEFFEDNMETWMTNFHGLLTLDNKLLQTDVSCISFLLMPFTFQTATLANICLCLCCDTSLGWGGGRSPRAPEVSDLRQRCSLRSEVWWRVPTVSSSLCHCYLEPFSFYWSGSQIWPGKSTDAHALFWSSLSPF